MSKINPSLLVCLWYWNFPARYMSTGMYVFPCIYTAVCMHYTIDYSFFIEQSEFCQLVLLVHKCTVYAPQNHQRQFWFALYYWYFISRNLLAIHMPHLPLVVCLHLEYPLLLLLIMSAFNSTDEHVGLIRFLNYELSGGRWRNLENEIHRKISLNEYSDCTDCTHYEVKRCTCKENSTSCSLLITIFLLVN